MIAPALLTAEQFAAREVEDLEAQGAELVAGRIVRLQSPGPEHGAVVLNFSKCLAELFQRDPGQAGYACYELGLIVARNPDTVRRPAISLYGGGERFAELDRRVSESRQLVLEIASTNDRRREMRERVVSYLEWGVPVVWVADTAEKAVHVLQTGTSPRILSLGQSIVGGPSFECLQIRVEALFALSE